MRLSPAPWILLALVAAGGHGTELAKPNILFIMTDDQDWHMESLAHMPFVQKYLLHEGTLFQNHFCTVALCCPSRANLWTGRAAHNTNVTDIFPPHGGYPKVVSQGINDDYLPIWLQDQGYNTYYSGKLWNGHTLDNYDSPIAKGFNGSDFILDPTTYIYYGAKMSRNGAPPVSYEGQYSPDVTASKAYGFLEEALQNPQPWFMAVSGIAPHSNAEFGTNITFNIGPPRYAPRHAHLFKDYKIPRTSDFNPEKQGAVGWIRKMPRLNDTVIEYNDEFQRSRLRALQAVDEMVEKLIARLQASGELDRTYIFYTTDNGYHISQHRLHPGKECGYETDIHIPLIVRGPGIPRGAVSSAVTSHTDLAPTILELAGGMRTDFDGHAIPLTAEAQAAPQRTEHVNVEYWGAAAPESPWGKNGDWDISHLHAYNAARNNTYKSVRVIGHGYNLYYSVWCTGDKEFYDLERDPGQIENYFDDDAKMVREAYSINGRPLTQVAARLDALLMVLKSCKTDQCRDPWKSLHPSGNVRTLSDAIAKDFDGFYHGQPKVAFTACELGYIPESEGPQHVVPLRDSAFQYQGPWHFWT